MQQMFRLSHVQVAVRGIGTVECMTKDLHLPYQAESVVQQNLEVQDQM